MFQWNGIVVGKLSCNGLHLDNDISCWDWGPDLKEGDLVEMYLKRASYPNEYN